MTIVIHFKLLSQELELLYPTPETPIYPNEEIEIIWKNPDSIAVNLYYKYDNSEWISLASSLIGTSYKWTLPNTSARRISFKAERFIMKAPVLYRHREDVGSAEIKSVEFSSTGKEVLTASKYGEIKLFDSDKGIVLNSIYYNGLGDLNAARLYDNQTVFASIESYLVKFNLSDSTVMKIVDVGYALRSLDCSSEFGGMVAAVCDDGNVYMYDTDLNIIRTFYANNNKNLYTVRFSKDGSRIYAGDFTGVINCFDVSNGMHLFSRKHSESSVSISAIWSIDTGVDLGKFASCGVDRKVRIWNEDSLEALHTFELHEGHVRSVRYSFDGKILVSGSLDGTLRLYDPEALYEFTDAITLHGTSVLSIDYSPVEDYVVSAGRGRDYKIWKVFRPHIDSSVVESIVKRRLELFIPDLTVGINEDFKIPLLTNISKLEIDFPESVKDIKLKLEIPIVLVDIPEFSNNSIGRNYDTLDIDLEFDGNLDTLKMLDAYSLLGPTNYGKLRILEINNDEGLEFTLKDGSVTILGDCFGDFERQINVGGDGASLTVNPNPASEYIILKINLLEDADYNLQITDISGRSVFYEVIQELKHGYSEFSLPVSNLPNGIYSLMLKGSNTKLHNLLIINR
ncbi:MAG: T9SS type A sorting domain-containing protein [Candidatus Kapaibacterium sp.]